MRVFVTGATGFVGSAVVDELLAAGHQVLGLARSDTAAASLAAKGAQVMRGALEDLDSLRRGAAEADGVIHTAFIHDFSRFKENCEIDRRAIDAIGDVLIGSERPLVVTSGLALLNPGGIATEDHQVPAQSDRYPRGSEHAALALAGRGVRASVVRLAPSVHGDGDHGFVPILIDIARRKGRAAYTGSGDNRWPGVHRLDAARLFRLALEKGATGACYHGVAEEGTPFREIAGVIGRHLQLPVASLTPEEAAAHFEWFTLFASMDCPASSAHTRQVLGWQPTGPDLLTDLETGTYFSR